MLSIWIVSVLLVLALWNLCFQKHWDSQLRVSATFKEESVYAGDETRLTEVIENHKTLFELNIYCISQEQAKIVAENWKTNAVNLYPKFIELLTQENGQ